MEVRAPDAAADPDVAADTGSARDDRLLADHGDPGVQAARLLLVRRRIVRTLADDRALADDDLLVEDRAVDDRAGSNDRVEHHDRVPDDGPDVDPDAW